VTPNPVCPYCRAGIDPAQDEQVICEGCDTPHHRDCYQENGGCTVFGCRCAPADEPKVRVSPPELTRDPGSAPRAATPSRIVADYSIMGLSQAAAVAPAAPAAIYDEPEGTLTRKAKMTFVMLGILLGPLGAHNFYAGYKKKAIGQLCLTALTLGYGAPMSWIWAIIDVLTVERDSQGIQFES